MIATYLWVAVGGALGSVARFWLGALVEELLGPQFPWGTILINILGSFIIGFYGTFTGPGGRMIVTFNARAFVMVGICGGFTTFSAFSLQTLRPGAREPLAASRRQYRAVGGRVPYRRLGRPCAGGGDDPPRLGWVERSETHHSPVRAGGFRWSTTRRGQANAGMTSRANRRRCSREPATSITITYSMPPSCSRFRRRMISSGRPISASRSVARPSPRATSSCAGGPGSATRRSATATVAARCA